MGSVKFFNCFGSSFMGSVKFFLTVSGVILGPSFSLYI